MFSIWCLGVVGVCSLQFPLSGNYALATPFLSSKYVHAFHDNEFDLLNSATMPLGIPQSL